MRQNNIKHPATKEEYKKIVLDSGLTVLVYPVKGYNIAHAVFATDFGSVDRVFSLNGTKHEIPAGVAHFLEHKMFENEDGKDAFELYAQTGASANAFTSFDKTVYLFTATDNIPQSLDILLSFVSHPYFTKETVQKEQGIIAQEIKMYDDDANWRILFALLECMYHNNPVKDDIAGSVESIGEITPEILYAGTDAFYNPTNMVLSVAGNITEEEVLAACEKAGLTKTGEMPTVEKLTTPEPHEVATKERIFSMAVAQPILGIAYKEKPVSKDDRIKTELIADMLTELIIGETTPLYRELYDEGYINAEFDGDLLVGDDYFSIFFSGETEEPNLVEEKLLQTIQTLQQNGIDEENFQNCKNVLYGESITELESVTRIATNVASAHLKKHTYFEVLDTLAAITLEDVNKACKNWFDPTQKVKVIITPKEA